MEGTHRSASFRRRRLTSIPGVHCQWQADLDRRWSQNWLADLMGQLERKDEFEPQANLCIRTDLVEFGSGLCMSIADLAHECLTNYFAPYRDAASVSWISREELRKVMLTSSLQHDSGNVDDFLASLQTVDKLLDDMDAILYVSRDARDFMHVHRDSFLDTLAVCLRTKKGRILILDMTWKPDSIM